MIEMVEPVDPFERAQAIRICRLNAGLDPVTGHKIMGPRLIDSVNLKLGMSRFMEEWLNSGLPYEKWIWMWNHGQAEWDSARGTNE